MPGDIDVALRIGRQSSAAVEDRGFSHQIALGLERFTVIHKAGVKHRRAGDWVLRFRLHRRAVPGDVNAAIFAERELSAADGADSDCASPPGC